MKTQFIGVVSATVMMLGGCATMSSSDVTGALAGAGAGGLACMLSNANDTECALLVAGGAVAGIAVARYIDREDADAYQQATAEILGGGQEAMIVSENTGNRVIAKNGGGDAECRTVEIEYDRRTQGTSNHSSRYCRSSSGSWELA